MFSDNESNATSRRLARHLVNALGALLTSAALVANAVAADTSRVSVDSAGIEAGGASTAPAIDAGGRFVAFSSDASELVPGDENGVDDIFVHDRKTGVSSRVSVSSAGVEGDEDSFNPNLARRGTLVVFESDATNLVSGDTNAIRDIFVHDRKTGATTRVSVSSGGGEADNLSIFPSASASGRFVAFTSGATNLVAGDTNGAADVFVHDTKTGTTTRVSVDKAGGQVSDSSLTNVSPAIDAKGRFVVFATGASDVVAGDINGVPDIFVHDRKTGDTARMSVDSSGTEANGGSGEQMISGNGRFIAFASVATNLVAGDTNGFVDIFVHDRKTGATTRVSVDSAGVEANGKSNTPYLSRDGRFVSFSSAATNLVAGDTNGSRDVFVHDRKTGLTTRVSVDAAGAQVTGDSTFPALTANGRFVAFSSLSSALVPADVNGFIDIFVRDRKE